jgi:hypothetical protein
MPITKIYTLEYSIIQDCYHIDTLEQVIVNNLSLINRECSNGYMLIGVFSNYQAASDFKQFHERINPNRLKEDYGTEANALI